MNSLSRRGILAASAASLAYRLQAADAMMKGRVNHSVCKWCYSKVPLEDLCKQSKEIGLHSIELLGPADWPTLKQYGLTCAMTTNPVIDGLGGIAKAFNRVEHHDKLVQAYEDWIPKAAAAGLQNVICFSGNRDGMADAQGLENCAIGLKRLMALCEKHKVNLVMELLNSKVNHKDYMCDHSEWGVALCKQVGSERFKLLYDIYHMQIMEGDVIRTIEKNHDAFGHYHTGGNPGRHEIDDSQELNYKRIAKAIADIGFKGYYAHEFIPVRDPLTSLAEAVALSIV